MNRRSFLKLSILGVAGAGLAIRSGAIFSIPRIMAPQGLAAWLPDPNGAHPFFGVDRGVFVNSSLQIAFLKELYAPDIDFYERVNDASAMIITAVDRDRKIVTVSAMEKAPTFAGARKLR